ncbi:MAG: phosphate/phosphite/phosphonate ABC transporter substrate-binding protein [Candidatus Paceibacterota bacterium]
MEEKMDNEESVEQTPSSQEDRPEVGNSFEEPSSRNAVIWGIGGVMILALIVFAAAYMIMSGTGNENDEPNDDEGESENGVVDDSDAISFGVLPLHNPSKMVDRFGALENYINEETDLNIKLRLYPVEGEVGGYSAAVREFVEGETGFVFLASVTTVQAYGYLEDDLEVIACGEKDGSPTYQGDLVVRDDSSYESIWDLEGEKVAGTSISSTSGGLMPEGMLMEEGIDAETFFEEGGITYLGSHDKALEAVVAGSVEAAFVNEQTMNKFLENGADVRSIWRHDPVPEFPILANKSVVSDEEIEKLREALLAAEEKEPLAYERIDSDYERFVEMSWEDYLPVKKAIDEVHGEVFYDLDEWGKEDEEE